MLGCSMAESVKIVPRSPVLQWVKDAYLKEGIDVKKLSAIEIKISKPVMLMPNQQGHVYSAYEPIVHIYGETDEIRRKKILVRVKNTASTQLKHGAELRFYTEGFSSENKPNPTHIEKLIPSS